MLWLLRGLIRIVLFALFAAALYGAIREIVGRLTEEPGEVVRLSSYDSWPAVPQAPRKEAAVQR